MTELNKICRACLNTIEYPKYVFFDNVSPDVFLFCTSIEIAKHEELPKVICDSCYDLLIKLYEFKKTCLQSHKTLLNYNVNSDKLEILTDLLPSNNFCQINEVWSLENKETLFSNDGNHIDNIIEKGDLEDFNGIDLDCSAFVEELPKRKYKKCKSSKEKPEKETYTCELCNKTFLHLYRFKLHKLTHQNKGDNLKTRQENRERQYTCEHCGKKYFLKKILLTHVTSCHSGKQIICQICNNSFKTKYNLIKHLRIHEGKKFKCEACDKSFSSCTAYNDHKRMHSGERPFVCNYCSKSFISNRILKEHDRTHTGERPFKCTVCKHSFAQSGTLKRHMKVHNKVPPTLPST